ncbi:MAG: carbon-nitrogen hydrolase [Myxococcota bacterium]
MPEPSRRIALVQQRASDDPERNLERAEQAIRAAAVRGAELVCLQELFRTPYFPQTHDRRAFELAEKIPGPTSEQMAGLARELALVLILPLFERRAAGVYHNSALVLDRDGSVAGLYRKMHIPDDPGFHEKFYFSPGDRGFRAIDTAVGRIGVLICWDQWFPEAARLLALDGATLLFFPTAIAWPEGEDPEERRGDRESWLTVQRGHAVANSIFVAACNRVGREKDLEFWGSSFVCDPRGRVMEQAPPDEESLLVVDCPIALIEAQRRTWPFLRDRRVDAYDDLLKRFRSQP